MPPRRSVSIVCLLPLFLAACGGPNSDPDPRTSAPLIRAALVQTSLVAPRSFSGVVAPRVQSDLGFRVSGKVLERMVDAGQVIKRGQPLMRIDPVDLGLQARAQQQAALAAMALAKQTSDEEARYRNLVATGAVSASKYDQVKAAADTARAQLRAAQAQADVAKNASNYAFLVADSDGVVMETLAEPGQVIAAGEPVIRLAHAGQREAIVHLPETLRPAPGSSAYATLYGSSGTTTATLRLLSDSADKVTRTFEARYVLQDLMATAPLGATITLRIPDDGHSASTLQVPLSAVFDPGQGTGVWVISGTPLRVNWRAIQVLSVGDESAHVTGNLEPGEKVAAIGAHLLHEGDLVRLADQSASLAAGKRP